MKRQKVCSNWGPREQKRELRGIGLFLFTVFSAGDYFKNSARLIKKKPYKHSTHADSSARAHTQKKRETYQFTVLGPGC